MRQSDAEEIWPATFAENAETLAAYTPKSDAYVATQNTVPIAVWGASPLRPATVSVWMFATDHWPLVAKSVTAHIKRKLRHDLMDRDLVRAECWSHEDHVQAHRWLEVLGAVREATVEDYCANRAAYHCFSWTLTRLKKEGDFDVHRRRSAIGAGTTATATTAADAGRPRS